LKFPDPPPETTGQSPPPLELLEDELLLDEDELLELLLDELDEEELLLEELDDELLPPSPTQSGSSKLPSWFPWKPNEALVPGCRLPFQPISLAVTVLPEVLKSTFQLPVTCGGSSNTKSTSQPLTVELPLLVTVTSNW
jgi:hypothetical protein